MGRGWRTRDEAGEGILAEAAAALSDRGDGWSIDCSYGAVWSAELTRGAASQFDPEIVQAFCRVAPPALAAGPVGR